MNDYDSSPKRHFIDWGRWAKKDREYNMDRYLRARKHTVALFNKSRCAAATTCGHVHVHIRDTAYIPATTWSSKNEMMEYAAKNNLKLCKSWNKQKMIQHIYKFVD